MPHWWEEENDYRKRSRTYGRSSSSTQTSSATSATSLHQNVKKASDNLVEEVKPGDPLLPWLFGTAGMLVTYSAINFGKAFIEIVNRGWPSE